MAARHPEVKQGIKRRGSNRDQLLAKAVKDLSGGIAKLLKGLFLACTGALAHRTSSIQKRIGDHLDQQASQDIK